MKTILCYGDSNTHGLESRTKLRFSEEERWTCLLQKYLGPDYHIIEEGLNGRTTVFEDPLYEGLNGLAYLYPCIMSHKPLDLLIIMLGTNDVKERFGATPDNVGRGMERLIQKAIDTREAFRDNTPKILLLAPPPILQGYDLTAVAGQMGKNCVEKSRALAEEYRKVAELKGCHFLDAGTLDGVEMSPYDCMHLSLDAHKNLAKGLAACIPELI